jgi:hypothetical protein
MEANRQGAGFEKACILTEELKNISKAERCLFRILAFLP